MDETSYEMIDRFLRNNLGDDDYAEYSEALDQLSRPTPRTWVGLTDEEKYQICNSHYNRDSELVEMVEAKLKEKNT